MIRRSWKSLVAGAALFGGIAVHGTASAADIIHANRFDRRAEQIFADSASPVAIRLTSGSCTTSSTCCVPSGCCESTCCAPVGCCESTCCAPTDCCDMGCGEGCADFGCDDEAEITFGGWVQLGYHSRVTPAAANVFDAGSFNNHPHRVNLHQGWLYGEKVADGSEGLDWGFRMDLMYGVDAADTWSFGNPVGSFDNAGAFAHGQYGFAIPQLYAELAAGDWSVKVGHFYTLIGYEVVTAPDNFFYSHALTMFNSEPFTHTGALVTYSASEDVTLYGGWTAGWDTGFDRLNGGSNFLGGFSVPLSDSSTLTYINTIGNFGWKGGGEPGYSHSIVVDNALTDKLNYVIQIDLLRVGTIDTVGLNQYMIYSLTDKIGIGSRTEWWKNEGNSQWAMTSGINIKPTDSLIFRPEVRHDWHNPNVALGGANRSTTTFGIDAIWTF